MKLKQTLSLLLLIAVLSGIAGCHWEAPASGTSIPSTHTEPPLSSSTVSPVTSEPGSVPAQTYPVPALVSFMPDHRRLNDDILVEIAAEAEAALQEHQIFRLRYSYLVLQCAIAFRLELGLFKAEEVRFRRQLKETIHYNSLYPLDQYAENGFITIETSTDPKLRYYQRFLVFLTILNEKFPGCILPNDKEYSALEYLSFNAYASSDFPDYGWKTLSDVPEENDFKNSSVDGFYYLHFHPYPVIYKIANPTSFPYLHPLHLPKAYGISELYDLSLYDRALDQLSLPLYGLPAAQWAARGILSPVAENAAWLADYPELSNIPNTTS